ncbi:MAG: enoyl-CoA hydratase [Hyphomicrobiaceae bacterium]
MSEFVEIVMRGASLEIVFNRAGKKNAITGGMYSAMADALFAAEAQPEVVSVIFSGHGAGFCSGNDLQDFLSTPMTEKAPVLAFLKAISTTSKVMIAAVQGPCVGIGATLLLHCDHVVAAPSASLSFNFVKIALVPEAGSSLLLPRAVGRLKAAELLLLGEPVAADEALRLGLVSRVVGEGEQLAAARAFADKLEALPPKALMATRRLLNGSSRTVEARMAEEVGVFDQQLRSPEFKEAVAAFMQKRAPDFKK